MTEIHGEPVPELRETTGAALVALDLMLAMLDTFPPGDRKIIVSNAEKRLTARRENAQDHLKPRVQAALDLLNGL